MFRRCKRKAKYLALFSVLIISLLLLFMRAPSWLLDTSISTYVPEPFTGMKRSAINGSIEQKTLMSINVLAAEVQISSAKQKVEEVGNPTTVEISQLNTDDDNPTILEGSQLSTENITDPDLCAWVNRSSTKSPYFLTAVLHVRIYEHDKAKLTTAEMNQWLLYLSYSGVEHVYVYDGFYTEDECQRDALQPFIQDNYITYIDWHDYNPYELMKTKIPAYQHCLDNYKTEHLWQTAIDIDEYPFSPVDTKPGFLARFVERMSGANPSVSHIAMQNLLFLGLPLKKELLTERLWRRTHGISNPLCKPIYKSRDVKQASIHNNPMSRGNFKQAPIHELRMNHYWGARTQNWGPDTPEILHKTEEDYSMEAIVRAFKDCEAHLWKYVPYTDGNYTYG